MDRITFGNCCSPFLAIYATRRAAEDFDNGRTAAVKAIKENLYMDDYLDSAKTEEEAISRAKDVGDILSSGDFHLTKWMSNSPEVLRAFQANSGEDQEVHLNGENIGCLLEALHRHANL